MHKINTLRKRIFFYCCVAMPLMVVLAAFFVIHPQFLTKYNWPTISASPVHKHF